MSPPKLAILGASGKLGLSTLSALLSHSLLPPSSLVLTSSSPSGAAKLQFAVDLGAQLRHANFDSKSSLVSAFEGCSKLFLISSARVEKDYDEAPPGKGREADHFLALEAAKEAGVEHVVYTSLAFGNPSLSRVMKAHERTEGWLEEQAGAMGMKYTVLREGLYSESWMLYFGHWDVEYEGRGKEVVVAGDGGINWTAIPDLGLATALVLADGTERWAGRTVTLAQSKKLTLREVAGVVSRATRKEVELKVVGRKEHEEYYVGKVGMDRRFVEWWSKTYDALRAGECEVDDPTLEELLGSVNVKPTSFEDTVKEMLK